MAKAFRRSQARGHMLLPEQATSSLGVAFYVPDEPVPTLLDYGDGGHYAAK